MMRQPLAGASAPMREASKSPVERILAARRDSGAPGDKQPASRGKCGARGQAVARGGSRRHEHDINTLLYRSVVRHVTGTGLIMRTTRYEHLALHGHGNGFSGRTAQCTRHSDFFSEFRLVFFSFPVGPIVDGGLAESDEVPTAWSKS